jgi:hypothetical protein
MNFGPDVVQIAYQAYNSTGAKLHVSPSGSQQVIVLAVRISKDAKASAYNLTFEENASPNNTVLWKMVNVAQTLTDTLEPLVLTDLQWQLDLASGFYLNIASITGNIYVSVDYVLRTIST